MPQRYTIKELEEWTDYEFLYWVVNDRGESITNSYSPLAKRLKQVQNKLVNKKKLTR